MPDEYWKEAMENMAAVTQRVSNHEVLCTERWTQMRDEFKRLNASVTLLLERRDQQIGAVKLARIVWLIVGAAVATIAWVVKELPWGHR